LHATSWYRQALGDLFPAPLRLIESVASLAADIVAAGKWVGEPRGNARVVVDRGDWFDRSTAGHRITITGAPLRRQV
jgi:hypothetical protein